MSSLCLAAGKMLVAIPVTSFTLVWSHSIEKTRWEEDWHIASEQLTIREARVQGAGAGMEPGAGAVFKNGIWHYQPPPFSAKTIRLSHSPYTAGYDLCFEGRCNPLAGFFPGIADTATIEISACSDRPK